MSLDIQTYTGNTTSDHLPILSVIPTKIKENSLSTNAHWKIFSRFSEYTYSFWEKTWDLDNIDITYNDYTKFLYLLTARCTISFPLDKYRLALLVELGISKIQIFKK